MIATTRLMVKHWLPSVEFILHMNKEQLEFIDIRWMKSVSSCVVKKIPDANNRWRYHCWNFPRGHRYNLHIWKMLQQTSQKIRQTEKSIMILQICKWIDHTGTEDSCRLSDCIDPNTVHIPWYLFCSFLHTVYSLNENFFLYYFFFSYVSYRMHLVHGQDI